MFNVLAKGRVNVLFPATLSICMQNKGSRKSPCRKIGEGEDGDISFYTEDGEERKETGGFASIPWSFSFSLPSSIATSDEDDRVQKSPPCLQCDPDGKCGHPDPIVYRYLNWN